MSRELTASQRGAVEHPLADTCVVASAGSGKTTVLTGRFVHLVRAHGTPPRRVAALTFTEKAAAEMRRRISEEFERSGDSVAGSEVEFAPVSTFHSFCARLLRTHAVEAGVDPAFVVLDETEALLLREDATVLAERQLRDAAPDDLLVLVRIGLSHRHLAWVFERVRGFGHRPGELRWVGEPCDVPRALERVRAALADVEREGASLPPEFAEELRGAAATVRALADAPAEEPGRPAPGRAAAAADLVGSLGPSRGRKKPWIAARAALKEALASLEGALLDDVGRREVLPRFSRVLAAVESSYEAAKRERSALDFVDLEIRTLALLDRLAAKGRRLSSAPLALLVDEYQDTSPLQARILERLRGRGTPQFAVGDPKQSIYRFRRADVRVIAAERERVGEANRRSLPETFRAREGLVDVLNFLHARLLADAAGGVPHEPMRAAGSFRETDGPEVEIAAVDAGEASADEGRVLEAAWIARYVRDLVEARVPRAKVEEGRPARPIGYGDVAILLRARGSLKAYEDALAAAEVPYATHRGRGYFLAEEVADLLHVLRVVHDPADRFALAAFASGPAMGAADGDLLRWFSDARGPWEALRDEALCDEGICGGPHRDVVRRVEELRREAIAGRLGAVVEGVLHGLGLLGVALLQPDGERRAANLRKAVETAREMERGGRHGLDDLLRRISLLRDREVAEAEATLAGDAEGAVRLMTVHAAKGLEFPVVILADAARVPPPVSDPVLLDGEGGIATKLVDPLEGDGRKPAGWCALQARETEAQRQESLRLLYVATTRAEERLLVTFAEGARSGNGWSAALRDALGIEAWADEERRIGRGTLRVRLVPGDEIEPRERPPALDRDAPDATALERAADLLAAAGAPTAPLGGTRYVVSVSELLAFAESPARYRAERLLPPGGPAPAVWASVDPDATPDPRDEDPEAGREAERRAAWDELPAEDAGPDLGGIDRAALGRAVHAAIERWTPGTGSAEDVALRAVEVEFGAEAPAGVRGAVTGMVERFARSPTAVRLGAALASGEDARREVAFHARIRFPGKRTVGQFDALLVKGTVDLWLPEGGRVWIVDHKTNPPTAHARTPDDLARRYAWQLRLYALAAERITGADVAGASLLLLDPAWGGEAIDVPIDVSGPALEEARRLCEAFAIAALEDRWPEDWRTLLRPA